MGARVKYLQDRRRWQGTAIHRYRRISKDFPNRAQAIAWASETFAALALGKPVEHAGRIPLSLAQWCDKFLKRYSTNGSDADNLGSVVRAFGSIRLDKVADWHLKRFIAARRAQGRSNKTINHSIAALRHAIYVAVREGIITDRPEIDWHALMLPTQARDRAYTDAELARLRAAMPEWLRDPLDLTLQTGLRRGDLLHLTREQVDLDRRVLTLRQRKTARPLTIPLTDAAVEIIRRHAHNWDGCGYLFATGEGKRLRYISAAFQRARRRAGTAGLTWHDLRHTFATRLVQAGAPRDVLASMLGDTPQVAALYANVTLDHKRGILEKACRAGVAFSMVIQPLKPLKAVYCRLYRPSDNTHEHRGMTAAGGDRGLPAAALDRFRNRADLSSGPPCRGAVCASGHARRNSGHGHSPG